MTFSRYIPLCDALITLMHPLIEVVIHDIQSDTICYINGSLSTRQVGNPALIDSQALHDLHQVVYPKINFDGRLVKSISIVLEDKWLLCINCDVSLFSQMQTLSKILLHQSGIGTQPKSLFAHDWQEKLHQTIHDYLKHHNLSFEHLRPTQKKALVAHLFNLGAFNEKNAADYIAKILRIGRATVFKYLKEWKKP